MKTNLTGAKFQSIPLIISILITLSIAYTASIFTRPQIQGWYTTLHKPSFNPPNWLFAPVWIVIYVLIAIAAYLVWKLRDGSAMYKTAVIIYIVQLLLNFSWSIVFFGMHEIFDGLVIIISLLVAIILNINWFGLFSKAAAWLLVPYLLWVSFATLLNLSIYILNK
ncbi:TspO/MBR family protein [Mucilaginibacter sp.]|jgi:tryptophan-rich sensory protein|uniref:TspO/MBR family protein n=1 Tax=Mucilaginibacter sp. TaxID=1882438 RepID=UPI003566A5B0